MSFQSFHRPSMAYYFLQDWNTAFSKQQSGEVEVYWAHNPVDGGLEPSSASMCFYAGQRSIILKLQFFVSLFFFFFEGEGGYMAASQLKKLSKDFNYIFQLLNVDNEPRNRWFSRSQPDIDIFQRSKAVLLWSFLLPILLVIVTCEELRYPVEVCTLLQGFKVVKLKNIYLRKLKLVVITTKTWQLFCHFRKKS